MNTNDLIKIPGRLHSTQYNPNDPSVNHIVSGTDEIYDESANAKQSDINRSVGEALDSKLGIISDLEDIRTGAAAGANAYQKPSAGIPKEDLSSAVQSSLNKADTALQEQALADWNESDSTKASFIKNKPATPAAQIQSDWNQTNVSSVDYIKNKPNIPSPITVDGSLSDISTNPVQNKVVKAALDGKQDVIPANTYDSYGAASTAKSEIIGGATSSGDTLKKLDDRVSPLETAVGNGGSVDIRIAAAKSEIIGDAASDYNTLGKLEDKIQAEASRAQAAEALKANSTDVYSKTETYTKTQVNGLVSTPHQNYVTVEATSQASYATDVLPASGQSPDTIYRVSNWDGSTNSYDITVYSEYAWDDVSIPNKYVFLCVKSQIGEVFDISEYNSSATYADLAAALGTNGANVPAEVRRGGMSVKYVSNRDNKYVRYNYLGTDTTDSKFTDVTNWVDVDNTLENVSEISKAYSGEGEMVTIVDNGDDVIVSIDSSGVNARNLKNNGKDVASAESVEVVTQKTESIYAQHNNKKIGTGFDLADDDDYICASVDVEKLDNNDEGAFILKYDDNAECLRVGKDGLFVNGEKIEPTNPIPPIRKLFNYKNIICCGDSVTEGYVSEGTSTQIYINRVVSDRSYPAQLQKMFPSLTVTTKAKSGDDASEWRDHFYANTDFSEYDLIIFELGLNGFLNINDIDTEGTNTYNYRKLIQDVRAQNADAVIVLVRSSHFTSMWMPVLNYIAQESDCVVIDLTDTTYLNLDDAIYHGYLYQNNEFIFDWAHFTRKGYDAKAYVVAHLIEDKLTDETIYN